VHPILFTLVLTPVTAQLLAVLFAIASTAIVFFDAKKKRGMSDRAVIETAAFGAVALGLAIALPRFVTLPESLPIEIRSWGVLVACAMFVGLFVQQRFAAKLGVDREHVFNTWLFGGATGLVIGRGIHVLGHLELYADRPLTAIAFWDGGLVFFGLLIGYAAFVAYYAIRHGLPRGIVDALALALPLGHAIGRLGCFLAGCCFGEPTDLPWAVSFEPGSIAYYALSTSGEIAAGATATMPLHPTQLYEVGAELFIFVLLLALARRVHAEGTIACAYLTTYPAARMLIEVLRADPERSYLFRVPVDAPVLLSESQAISVVLIVGAAIGWYWLDKRLTFRPVSS
jgi:phosphatidylglycerol---prolipoprotein diacylglyceryl transferase